MAVEPARLSRPERSRLVELEAVVERGLETFIEVGTALMEIRDTRLYRDSYATFEAYLRERWDMSRSRGYQLIDAAAVSTMVDRLGLPAPASEREARELAPYLRLAPDERDTALRALVPHGSHGTGNEWYTPAWCIEKARDVLGDIDLDPASSDEANKTVKAPLYYTEAGARGFRPFPSGVREDQNGLAQPWRGRVWMNPPYQRNLCAQFVNKLVDEYEDLRVTAAVVLLRGYSYDAKWFHAVWDYFTLCFVMGRRVEFSNPHHPATGSPNVGPVFGYLGPDRASFVRVFSDLGYIAEAAPEMTWRRNTREFLRAEHPEWFPSEPSDAAV